MEFIKTADPALAAKALQQRLLKELSEGKKVLWLLSGGSSIPIEATIIDALRQAKSNTGLTIMLLDERYGPVGHAESNWQQLINAGADFTGLHTIPILGEPLESLEATVAAFARHLSESIALADIVVGVFGVGPDGHVAGILPESPAATDTDKLVVGYEAPPLIRLTPTRKALLKVNVGYSFVFGDTKAEALRRLRQNDEPFSVLPSKLLWELPEAYVYNDQVES